MSLTIVGSAFGRAPGAGQTTVATTSTIATQAGDLVLAWVKVEANDTPTNVTDGTSNLTLRVMNFAGANVGGLFAWFVSPNTGSLIYTANWGVGTITPAIYVYVFRPSATPVVDTAVETASNFDTGPVITGNITTTGTDELVFYGITCENPLNLDQTINGLALTGEIDFAVAELLGYRAFASTFTGQGSCTMIAGSARWVASLIAFKITAADGLVGQACL